MGQRSLPTILASWPGSRTDIQDRHRLRFIISGDNKSQVEDADVTTQPSSSSLEPVASQAVSPGALATRFWIGCSGWAYPTWKPEFYPPKTSPKKMLEHYASRLNSVEVNYTFRHLPSASTIDGWLAQTGPDFRFSFKAPQRITHIKRLKECSDALSAFYSALLPVIRAGRMGVLLFQLPPNLKADPDRLATFLKDAAPENTSTLRVAFEFRHASWFASEIFDLLRQHQAALCVAESDELATPDVVTAPFCCYRLRKSDYEDADLQQIEEQLTAKATQGDVFAYIKHEDSPKGALQAAALLTRLRAQ
jgi:uncharacterized protein YecE (DUF72 family)